MRKAFHDHENKILTVLFLTVLGVAVSLSYDYYYDLNDDVLMKDIVAGVYTGTPESRNIQMLYLISAFISFFYRMFPGMPWYGLLLCIGQFGSIGLIVNRSLSFCRSIRGKIGLLIIAGAIIIGTMLEHLVFVQYTITCTMLAAAAVFLFITTDERLDHKQFLIKNVPVFILAFIAFLIRSEMFLLVLPFYAVAGLYKWSNENQIFKRENFIKYFSVLGCVLAGMIVGQATHMIAYGSGEWQQFTEFFDNRTKLYDYEEIPAYAEHAAFYEGIGLSESEVTLLLNYNFGLDEEIDETIMGRIADYAAGNRKQALSFSDDLTENVKLYVYQLSHGSDYGHFPWNGLVIIGYAGLLGLGIMRRKTGRMTGKLLLLLAVRTVLWLYILMGNRYPPRIVHSLYFIELGILLAMFLVESRLSGAGKLPKKERTPMGDDISGIIRIKAVMERCFPAFIGVLILVMAGANIPGMVDTVDRITFEREETNRSWQAMQQYCRDHSENYYFIDVYSTVDYSEKIFKDVNYSPINYDYMGGWANKSPLYKKKLRTFLKEEISMQEALAGLDNVYMISEPEEGLVWLEDYYRDHGQEIEIKKIDSIADKLEVYLIR